MLWEEDKVYHLHTYLENRQRKTGIKRTEAMYVNAPQISELSLSQSAIDEKANSDEF